MFDRFLHLRRLYKAGNLGGAAVFGLMLTALAGCTPSDVLNATISERGLTVTRDIAYSPDAKQTLDIYVPKAAAPNAPVIVFFYGGAWQTGDKKDYLFAAQAFASKGNIVVVPNYRVYPQVTFPGFIDDGAMAVAWTASHIGAYGGNPDGLFIIGHSAGAHIALMLALDAHYLTDAGVPQSKIAGVVGISGPYDFLPLTRDDIKPIFEVVPDLAVTQPIHFVRDDAPPLLLLTGDDDDTVGPYNTNNLTERMRQVGGRVEKRIYPGVGHVGSILAVTPLFRGKAPVLDDIETFIRQHKTKAP